MPSSRLPAHLALLSSSLPLPLVPLSVGITEPPCCASVPPYRRRCEQYDVALDAFQHMLAQSLPVSGPVFQAVLGAQLDRGAWEEVGRLLDTMHAAEAEVDAEVGGRWVGGGGRWGLGDWSGGVSGRGREVRRGGGEMRGGAVGPTALAGDPLGTQACGSGRRACPPLDSAAACPRSPLTLRRTHPLLSSPCPPPAPARAAGRPSTW